MRKLSVLLLLLLMIGSTSFAFAWWDSLDTSLEQEFELGVGVRLELDNQTTAGQGLLIPAGSHFAGSSGYTTSYTFLYSLSLPEDLGDFDLAVALSDVTVGGVVFDNSLGVHGALQFELLVDGVSQGNLLPGGSASIASALSDTTATSVQLSITLLPQASTAFADATEALAAYNALNGRIIAFTIAFELE